MSIYFNVIPSLKGHWPSDQAQVYPSFYSKKLFKTPLKCQTFFSTSLLLKLCLVPLPFRHILDIKSHSPCGFLWSFTFAFLMFKASYFSSTYQLFPQDLTISFFTFFFFKSLSKIPISSTSLKFWIFYTLWHTYALASPLSLARPPTPTHYFALLVLGLSFFIFSYTSYYSSPHFYLGLVCF